MTFQMLSGSPPVMPPGPAYLSEPSMHHVADTAQMTAKGDDFQTTAALAV